MHRYAVRKIAYISNFFFRFVSTLKNFLVIHYYLQ